MLCYMWYIASSDADNIEKLLSSNISQAMQGALVVKSYVYIKHQCRPDLYFVNWDLLVSDFKPDDFQCAEVQTFSYYMTIVNIIGSKPFIAMPCTKERFVIYVAMFFRMQSTFTRIVTSFPLKCLKQTPMIVMQCNSLWKFWYFLLTQFLCTTLINIKLSSRKGLS